MKQRPLSAFFEHFCACTLVIFLDSRPPKFSVLHLFLFLLPFLSIPMAQGQSQCNVPTTRAYCASCQGVIQQFNNMFPNVKLILVDGVR